MQNGVPSLLAKIALYQPRVVCFVGKQIGEVFLKTATSGLPSTPPPTITESVLVEKDSSAKTRTVRVKKTKPGGYQIGFQPYKVVHPAGSMIKETLFFIMPSSSARVIGYQVCLTVPSLCPLDATG